MPDINYAPQKSRQLFPFSGLKRSPEINDLEDLNRELDRYDFQDNDQENELRMTLYNQNQNYMEMIDEQEKSFNLRQKEANGQPDRLNDSEMPFTLKQSFNRKYNSQNQPNQHLNDSQDIEFDGFEPQTFGKMSKQW